MRKTRTKAKSTAKGKAKRSAALRKTAASRKAGTPARRAKWTAQDARAHFSEVLDAAVEGRPQEITRGGKEAVVVVSAKDYKALTKPKQSLREFFLNSPLAEAFGDKGIPEVRHKERLRDIDFGD